MDIFEQATRQKLRFASERGDLSTEQLWELPLTSRNGFDLDTVAKGVNAHLREVTEDSFVTTSTNPAKAGYELRLEVVKHIIAVRLREAEENRQASARAAERERLRRILDQKNEQELAGLSREDLEKRLAELGG